MKKKEFRRSDLSSKIFLSFGIFERNELNKKKSIVKISLQGTLHTYLLLKNTFVIIPSNADSNSSWLITCYCETDHCDEIRQYPHIPVSMISSLTMVKNTLGPFLKKKLDIVGKSMNQTNANITCCQLNHWADNLLHYKSFCFAYPNVRKPIRYKFWVNKEIKFRQILLHIRWRIQEAYRLNTDFLRGLFKTKSKVPY